MSIVWKGVFPAVTTKFTENDEFDFDAFDKNIEAQLEAGASGIIIGGSLGEASVLNRRRKDRTAKAYRASGCQTRLRGAEHRRANYKSCPALRKKCRKIWRRWA
jgi:dihydrodipicolinate synthase/N-acetylneuraminate lyase